MAGFPRLQAREEVNGLLVAGARFAGPGVFDTGAIHPAIGMLVISTVLGIVTYNESNLYVGPKGDFIERLTHDQSTDERWDRRLLETFAGMISENEDIARWNAWLLTATQGTLIFGIVAAVLATAI